MSLSNMHIVNASGVWVPVSASNPLPTTNGGTPGTLSLLGQVLDSPDQAGTATVTTVAQNAASVQLIAANARTSGSTLGRRGLVITNTSTTSWLYINYGATAVITGTPAWAFAIPPHGSYSMTTPVYSGLIDGIWDAVGSAFAVITELTT